MATDDDDDDRSSNAMTLVSAAYRRLTGDHLKTRVSSLLRESEANMLSVFQVFAQLAG